MILDFYQLREQPFGVTPDPAYLYASRTHCEALDSLTEAILGDRGFMALIAEPGMGKTTLLNQVLESLRDAARVVYLFQTQCNSREFFQYLMNELGVDSTGMGLVAMHNQLNEILFAEMLAGRRFVLVVDEAQNLDDSVLETIRLLSNFETPHSKLMQIVLAGQPQLGEKLARPQLAQLLQRLTGVKHLEALSAEETAGYVRHRMKIAGRHAHELFEPEALALLAERSQGIPRIINKICYRSLLEGYAAGCHSLSAGIVEKAAAKLEHIPPAQSRIPRSAPAQALPTADSVEPALTPSTPQLTYQSPATNRLATRAFRTGALIAVLLSAGLALPHAAVKQFSATVRGEVATTKSLIRREAAYLGGPPSGIQDSAAIFKSSASTANGEGMPSITAINASSTANDAQVVVMLDNAIQYESARISSPDRIYFDLHKTRLRPSVGQTTIPPGSGLLKRVRVAQNSGEMVRMVLDADGSKDFSAKLLSDPYRLVIDVHAQPVSARRTEPPSDTPPQSLANPSMEAFANRPVQFSLARELGLKINRIAIDPGHGGYDTGTTGPRGLLEKDLCLDVALRLGQLIKANRPGAEVVYTRTGDRHIGLEERTKIANDSNADLFISIHANSSDFRQIRGVETFYLSLATSGESRDLATRENSLAESAFHNLPDLIGKITRNEKFAESRQLALDLQNSLAQQLQLVSRQEANRGVKQAPFIVLTGANMPAVLSEISFVSNASDESLLFETAQRQRIAEGLYRGVASYLDRMPGAAVRSKQKLFGENHVLASPPFQ
jgi:N-acetylmuramoyl-L-alanine amidase/type II secretory pathway predicted ATPase ExeA